MGINIERRGPDLNDWVTILCKVAVVVVALKWVLA